jgi:hypothetical protein
MRRRVRDDAALQQRTLAWPRRLNVRVMPASECWALSKEFWVAS